MSLVGWYYLHENGDLIYKRDDHGILGDFSDSDLVKKWWPVDPEDRMTAWNFVLEASRYPFVSSSRLNELRDKWDLTKEDYEEYKRRAGVNAIPYPW